MFACFSLPQNSPEFKGLSLKFSLKLPSEEEGKGKRQYGNGKGGMEVGEWRVEDGGKIRKSGMVHRRCGNMLNQQKHQVCKRFQNKPLTFNYLSDIMTV